MADDQFSEMNPFSIEDAAEFKGILDMLPFAGKVDTSSMYVQFKHMLSYLTVKLKDLYKNDYSIGQYDGKSLIKCFVKDEAKICPDLVRLLSFCICFPVSEAIVETWGSTISRVHQHKPHSKEPVNDVTRTGTVDKICFIMLNGPPPGRKANDRFLEQALYLHFNSEYSRHFVNTTRYERITSKVVERVLKPPPTHAKILPWYQYSKL